MEIFKDIKGYEGFYQISNYGKIKSLKRITPVANKYTVVTKERFMKPSCTNGYLIVQLSRGGNIKSFLVHRLVALAFIENPQKKLQINHKDGDKKNNSVENLEWVTPSENLTHAHAMGLKPATKPGLGKFGANSHAGKKVVQMDRKGFLINKYDTMSDASKITGICLSSISGVCNGKRKTAGGYIWNVYEFYNNIFNSAADLSD